MKKINMLVAFLLLNISLYGANASENGEDKEAAALQELQNAAQHVSQTTASEISGGFLDAAKETFVAFMACVSDWYENSENPLQERRRNRSNAAYNQLDNDPTMQAILNRNEAIEKR